MLHLHEETQARWLKQVQADLPSVLIDHAHCEHKAAATAMSLLGSYIERQEVTDAMTEIIAEELEHFRMVREVLQRRGIPFRKLPPGHYGKELQQRIRLLEPDRAVDRMLVSGLIEARSCERFDLLRKHIDDPELQSFYDGLFESEARHHSTYVRLAKCFAPAKVVQQRLEELAVEEAAIIAKGWPRARMHS